MKVSACYLRLWRAGECICHFRRQDRESGFARGVDHLGVPIVTDSRVVNIIASNLFEIMTVSGKLYRSDVVVLATGGKCLPSSGSDGSGYALAEQLGHSIVPVAPGIVPLALKESWPAAVSGVKCDARLSVIVDGKPVAVFRGDTLFADYGITGTAVIQISERLWPH